MKHDFRIIAALLVFFFLAQIVGLFFVYNDVEVEEKVTDTGEIIRTVYHPETALGARPEVTNFDAVLMILFSVLVGTSFILLIVKFNKLNIWKGFFFFAVFFSITIAIGVFIQWELAVITGLVLSALKLLKRGILVHNVTEVLIYTGIAVLFAPLFEPLWVIVLLLAISVYDAFAVWQSKHMIKMAEFQIKSEVFAGLSIPYKRRDKKSKSSRSGTKATQAILGGGDVAFPLIFAASVMESLIKLGGIGMPIFFKTLAIPLMTAIALLALFVYGKRGRYYPAMPFVTVGALVGYGLILVL